jgi:hypothetical protein
MLEPCADGVRLAHPLSQEGGEGCRPISALQLRVIPVGVHTARGLNWLWHRTLPRTSKTNLCRTRKRAFYVAECRDRYYAVAIWTDPVSPTLSCADTLELRRLAVAPDAPRNTCSRMLAVMARLLHRRFPDVARLISYQAVSTHAGTIYRAAGWTQARETRYRPWDREHRPRKSTQQQSDTVRWEKVL